MLGKSAHELVYSAAHRSNDHPVAVKILKKAALKLQDLENLKREIEILKLCQHPHIVRLLDVFEDHEQICMVMERLDVSLMAYVEKRGSGLPEERTAKIVHTLATAVYYMHTYGVVHRDLRLENVMMADTAEESEVKVGNFWLSKIVGPNEKSTDQCGTPGISAPEMLQGLPYDKRVDIWSLGVILYALLCGRLPFEDETEAEASR